MTINYYIQMPPKLAADLNQKYGNINLPSDNNGNMDIHVKYGNPYSYRILIPVGNGDVSITVFYLETITGAYAVGLG